MSVLIPSKHISVPAWVFALLILTSILLALIVWSVNGGLSGNDKMSALRFRARIMGDSRAQSRR